MCPPNRPFRCKNDRVCLWIGRQCDGTDNCGDGTDEEDCGEQGASEKELWGPLVGCVQGVGVEQWEPCQENGLIREGEVPLLGAWGPFLGVEKPLGKSLAVSLGLEVETEYLTSFLCKLENRQA